MPAFSAARLNRRRRAIPARNWVLAPFSFPGRFLFEQTVHQIVYLVFSYTFPDFIVRTIKRTKHQPIWIPGPNFPANPMDIYDQIKPFMRGDEIVWRHIPTQRRANVAVGRKTRILWDVGR